jgi:hypothetical protein
MAENVKILKCNCAFEMQDKLHGKQMRVHNKTTKKAAGDKFMWRCTVCLKERAE